jgi:hypothetical protein
VSRQGDVLAEMTEPEVVLCSRRPFENLSACVREEAHEGRCVFCRGSRSSLNFYEETARGGGFKAIVHADLKPGERPSRQEAAAVFALLKAAKDRGK